MQIIERSNAFEFQLYAQVGRKSMDTSGCHQIFTSDSPAWRAIEKVVHGSIEDEYTLDLERSHRALLSVELKQITDSTLVVGSREAWTIIWNSEIAPDTRYDEVNEQLYTLLNDNGHWKVDQNEYEGKYVVTEEKE